MRARPHLDLSRHLVLDDARHDSDEAVARGFADDRARLGRRLLLGGELRQRRTVHQPLPAFCACRREPSVVGPAPHRVGADAEQLGGLPDPKLAHAGDPRLKPQICDLLGFHIQT